jgi:hypothetical protein
MEYNMYYFMKCEVEAGVSTKITTAYHHTLFHLLSPLAHRYHST